MATKSSGLSSFEGKLAPSGIAISNSDPQFVNLNLNQNQKCLEPFFVPSKNISFDVKNKKNYASFNISDLIGQNNIEKQSKLCFLNKNDRSLNPLTSECSNVFGSTKKQKKVDSSNKSSTLSLHIAAYENSSEAVKNEHLSSIKTKSQNLKAWKSVKQLLSTSASMNSFEIPRQQENEKTTEPEIMQFKTSQKLVNSNQENDPSTAGKVEANDEFEKHKDEANKLFKAKNYDKAAKAYNRILVQFGSKINNAQKSIIFSNRSAAYLMLKDEASKKQAKFDAEMAIKLNATWWKGYFRIGQAQCALDQWHEAENSFEKALVLNPESTEIRDELSAVRAQIGFLTRGELLGPSFRPLSKEQRFQDVSDTYGISRERMEQIEQITLDIPGIGDAYKAEHFRDGIGGVQQDYKKAFEYYLKAAEKGISDAMFNLGVLYQNGKGVKRDYKESMKWLLKAANVTPSLINASGISEAQHLIGLNYSEGVGVDKDYKKAAEWYEKAAQNGCAPSVNNLGLLYQQGHGVEKNAAKSFQYFKVASQKGETPAMINLANCYFDANGTGSIFATQEDIAEGEKWLRLAADKGDNRTIQQLLMRKNLPTENPIFEAFSTVMSGLMAENANNPLNYEQFGEAVTEAAKKGSATAQRHMDIWKNFDDALKAFKKNDSGGVVAALSKAIHLDFQIVKIPDLLKPVVEERIKSHPNELDAAVCFVNMNSKNPSAPYLIDQYSKMFPNDDFLTEMSYSKCIILNDLVGALKIADAALKRQPNSLRLLYCRAIAFCQSEEQLPECIKALDAFLALAPKDHDKVPACYYRKATYYLYRKNMANFISSYEAGLAAEKEQLPCFLPYFFKYKSMLEMAYMATKQSSTSNVFFGNKENERAPTSSNSYLERIKLDIKRKLLIKKNRETFIGFVEHGINAENMFENSAAPPNTPKPPSTKNLKKITLKEMDRTKDKIYDGFILEARIIDWTFPLIGIAGIIEDENGDVHRLAIYNWPLTGSKNSDISKVLKDFHPNFKVSIINPYMKLERDGSNVIRVESPEFIQIDKTFKEKQCYCCGKEAKILPCSGCLMAKYCSKECQKFDWTEFNHKEICKHLKSFANIM